MRPGYLKRRRSGFFLAHRQLSEVLEEANAQSATSEKVAICSRIIGMAERVGFYPSQYDGWDLLGLVVSIPQLVDL
jgi:hypothetical protein